MEIKNLQEKLKEAYKNLIERHQIAQHLIQDTIKDGNTQTASKIGNIKKILTEMKREAEPYHLTTTFVSEQEMKIARFSNKNNVLECLPTQTDTSVLYRIKRNILMLEKVVVSLIKFCHYLNPLKTEQNCLHTCITSKIRHIHLQVSIIELEFREQLNAILNRVKKCTEEKNASINKVINDVILNLHQFESKKKH